MTANGMRGGSGKRPLGVPTVEDKVIQMAPKKTLEAINKGACNIPLSPFLSLSLQRYVHQLSRNRSNQKNRNCRG